MELGTGIVIRDQKPLSAGSIAFEDGWNLERFVSYVNDHVFFWPGTESGPIDAGINHYTRYAHEQPVVLRFPADPNTLTNLYFCRYNSGAPRCSGGKHSPRGSFTYQPASHFNGSCSQVTEVVAKGKLALPGSTQVAASPSGPWAPLAGAT
ncbi:hypothetical protein MKFW12EY_27950 [Methylomonas koyamae]|nr:hypothetical protein MKFW12EY_27950 [Methylomonas koyamae]